MPHVRGPYHQALLKLLLVKYAERAFTQESLALATGKEQTTIGQYLKPTGKAGTLDLDEADAALAHIGSSLKAFLTDPSTAVTPRRTPQISPVAKQLAVALQGLPDEVLRVVLATARAERARLRHTKIRSTARRVVGPHATIRRIGGKR